MRILQCFPQIDLHLQELESLVRAERLRTAEARHHATHHGRLHHLLHVGLPAAEAHRLRLIAKLDYVVVEVERVGRYEARDEIARRDVLHFFDFCLRVFPFRHNMAVDPLVRPEQIIELVLIPLLAEPVAQDDIQVVDCEHFAVLAEFVEERFRQLATFLGTARLVSY